MTVTAKTIAHGGNIARAARKYGLSERQITDFSASINPLGPAPGVLQALMGELWRIRHYPDPDCGELPHLLAGHLGVRKDNLLLGNGGAELIYLLPRALDIKSALVLAPTFSEYAKAVEAAGGRVEYLALSRGGKFPAAELAARLQGCDAVFLCNPNNPTGQVFSRAELGPLLDCMAGKGVNLIVDEAFMDFVAGRENTSLMPMVCTYPGLVVLYSMTKFFGIPGLRLGAAVAAPEIIDRLRALKDPWSVNALAVVAGEAALKDKRLMDDTLRVVQEEREYLFAALSDIPGIEPFPSAANFLLMNISGTGLSSTELADRTGRLGILVRDCANFHGLDSNFIRVAVRTREENRALVEALRQVTVGE